MRARARAREGERKRAIAWEGRLVRRRANRVSDSWQRGQRERKNDTNRTFSGLSGYVFTLQNVHLFFIFSYLFIFLYLFSNLHFFFLTYISIFFLSLFLSPVRACNFLFVSFYIGNLHFFLSTMHLVFMISISVKQV